MDGSTYMAYVLHHGYKYIGYAVCFYYMALRIDFRIYDAVYYNYATWGDGLHFHHSLLAHFWGTKGSVLN